MILTLYIVLFILQKDCPSGKLNKKKFIEVYKQFYPTGKAEKFCEYVFRTFDTDGSGNIGNSTFLIYKFVFTAIHSLFFLVPCLYVNLSWDWVNKKIRENAFSMKTNMQFTMHKFSLLEHIKRTQMYWNSSKDEMIRKKYGVT